MLKKSSLDKKDSTCILNCIKTKLSLTYIPSYEYKGMPVINRHQSIQ